MSNSAPTLNPGPASSHPPVETWIDYFAGDVAGGKADDLRRHLTHCRSCVDLVLDLDAFAEPATPRVGAAADFEKAAVWRTVKHALPTGRSARARHWPTVAAVAASVVFAALGLSAWTQRQEELNQLRSQIAAFSNLQANAVVLNLRPGTRERSSGGSAALVDLGDEPRMLVFILNLGEDVDAPAYEVRVLDSNGTEVARVPGLEISALGNFQLALMSDLFHTGGYELRLFGLEGESERQLETFTIQVR